MLRHTPFQAVYWVIQWEELKKPPHLGPGEDSDLTSRHWVKTKTRPELSPGTSMTQSVRKGVWTQESHTPKRDSPSSSRVHWERQGEGCSVFYYPGDPVSLPGASQPGKEAVSAVRSRQTPSSSRPEKCCGSAGSSSALFHVELHSLTTP